MVLKMNAKLEFCGKERKFQRCANKTLKDYQKTIEEIQDKITPLAERTRDYQFELTELTDEQEAIDKHIELLEKLDDASDSEIRECIALTKQKIELQKKIHELRKANDEAEKEDREFYENLDQQLRDSYGEFASKIFENFDPSEIEEADSTDLTIAPRLSELYRLATTGVKQKEVDKLYQKIIKDSFR
jgi:chromosome segregation ATPase